MSFIAKNPLTIPEIESSPPVPKSGTRGLFAKADGWYDINHAGDITKLSGSGGGGGGSVDISGKEDKENKVFELSDGSTDEQYPSAKATVDYVKSEIGSLINNAPSKTIGFNEVVPAGSLPSICDFEFKPNTPLCIYNLYDSNVLPKGQFFGEEIPFLTTRGNLIIVDSNNNIKLEKYIDSLINITNQTYGWNVSDTLTQNGLNKVWSNKFYLTMDKYKERVDSGVNSVYTFELDESDFAETGIPAKLDNIPIASPCFYPGTANGTLYGGDPFKLKFSYNKETDKYIMTIRGFGVDFIFYQLQQYSKAYIYYQLETPYVEKEFLAMNLEEGDKILFENDYSYIQKYLDIGNFFKKGTNGDYPFTDIEGTTPTIATIVPQNTLDALNGFSNAARIFNEGQASDDDVAQDYSWIGDGDDSLDYTSIIQNKIKELSTISNGGTIYLGNGTYKINNFIEVYDNIKIIGTGNTTIQQTNKNEHVLVISGSKVTIKDLKLKLYAMTAEEKDSGDYNSNLTACLYINSNNGKSSSLYNSKYLDNIYCTNLTVENVYLSGSYGFRYINGKPTVSNDYEHYRGCGLINEKLFFNYATLTNVYISGMYHGLHGCGGSNDITIFCTESKTMVYGNGGYLNLNIYGHSYYDTDNDGNTISMSDEVGHFIDTEQSYIAEYVYDTQWLKNIFIFDGYTMNNRYLISQTGGASYTGNDEENSDLKLKKFVIDYGRGNRAVENFQNTPYHIGAKYIAKTGLTSFKANDPITQNALSGAGVWGNINSNDAFDAGRLTLSEICRYPNADKDINKFSDSSSFFYALSHNTPTEENPIEIIIDISNRPIFALPSCFIQFSETYIASDFEVSFKYSGYNDFSNKINVKDNTDVVWYYTNTQYLFKKIDKIKIVITKALYIEKLKYQNSGYVKYEIEYNPDKKVGICNIGVIDANFTGRAFLGECGGNVYGDLVLNKNSTIKNVPSPVDDTDVVNKRYVDDQKEDKSNKVTDITGNETSEKYPTVLAVIDYLKKNGGSGGGGMTEQEIRDLFADIIESRYVSATDTVSTPRIWMYNNNDWSGFVRVDANGNETTMEQTLATLATKKELGDIDAALDEIIAIQNRLIGGASS